MIITIDGPAGSGKSTVADKLAKRLGFIHLNSGAIFRAVAVLATDGGISLEDGEALAELARRTTFCFERTDDGSSRLLANGQALGSRLSSEESGKWASLVAVHPQLRTVLRDVQQEIGRKNTSLVVEGRDSGTVVFPKADRKFYLDADVETRAGRRLRESGQGEVAANDEEFRRLAANIRDRDKRDAERTEAPLQLASDAVVIDTSALSVEEVVEKLLSIINTNP